ncbi:hypothetical protein ES705_29036 [subsurface metagenome]
MAGYRCHQDFTGYCQDPSRQGETAVGCSDIGHPGVHVLQTSSPTKCTLSPASCGFFITWKEVLRGIQPIKE